MLVSGDHFGKVLLGEASAGYYYQITPAFQWAARIISF